ncbi:MAG TPA: UDP-glucose/GDP-mannose dehydrogenase family protein [Acidimicrobiales bacterium]|nr:UDP-glucose/GDP-mannose dehydrogenase family protein [Acidimicrobiales bacterium]
MSRVAVVGAGYVGLTTAAFLAHLGHRVVGADVVPEKVERLNGGEVPIVEAGLEELVREGIEAGRLSFVVGAAAAVPEAEFVFLCLPTPQGADDRADMSFIEAAAAEIGPHVEAECIVVNKSTVPVGSTRAVQQALHRDDVFVVSNPEFLREGSAVHDCLHPDRIVIGSEDGAAAMRLAQLYESVQAPVIITDPVSAETIKYASNAFLAAKISFVNAIANLCEAVGADVREVALGMGYDRRIGFEFLKPGPGWGGSCFPKDTRALIRIAEDHGYDFSLLRGVVDVNEQQYGRVVDKIARLAGRPLDGARVGVWGLTFKARTDDLRASPSLAVIERLRAAGASVRGFDPTRREPLDGLDVVADPYAACEDAHVLAVLTEWDEFRWLDFDKVGALMAQRAVVDARNLLDPGALRRRGFVYEGIGRT